MKITRYPWQENTEVDMDDLFTELVLQKLNNKPYGCECVPLGCYRELFDLSMAGDESTKFVHDKVRKVPKKVPSKKILMKGEPGVGKTTLMKKIVHNSANAYFDAVSLVFFVPLKLVKPGEAIDTVIVDKTYGLKGLKVTPSKVKSILETFGSRCLLILDGLDEHALGQNTDVKEIIRGESTYIVTSLSHPDLIAQGRLRNILIQ